MAKIETFSLDVDDMIDNFFEGARLFGIVANFKNYKFCWYINQMMGYNFVLNPDINIVTSKKNRQYYFPVYECSIPNSSVTHYLYDNTCDGEFLIPKYKNIDFLWLIKDGYYIDDSEFVSFINVIKNTHGVQTIFDIDIDSLSDKGMLIF